MMMRRGRRRKQKKEKIKEGYDGNLTATAMMAGRKSWRKIEKIVTVKIGSPQ